MGSNRILPVVAGLVMIMLVFVGVKSFNSDPQDTSQLTEVPQPGTPDADSPADTIRTLTAEVAAIKSESKKLNQQNEALLRQREEITHRVKAQLREDMQKDAADNEASLATKLTQQLDFFRSRLDELSQAQNQGVGQGAEDIPVGFGLTGRDGLTMTASDTVWVEPLGTQTDDQGQPVYISPSSAGGLLKTAQQLPGEREQYLEATAEELIQADRPAYTVPRNSTLIGSTGMTAMIGRIPVDGAVEDPFPFKAIVGKDNLAANGIEMPGLDGMIFSGKASGDWTLSCVRGQLQSVTYVFADGTVRTLSSDDEDSPLSKGQGSKDRALGWISDRRGIPCVTGTRISNAATYLSGRILASAAEAAAGAFSQSEVTNTVSPIGGVATSVITGDSVGHAGGKALSGGAAEVSEYLRERAAQSFDAIYVDTGVELAIHVDVELPIDFEQQGRKTTYAYTEQSKYHELD